MSEALKVPTMADYVATGETPEILFWWDVQGVLMIEQKK